MLLICAGLLHFRGSMQLLDSSHVRDRDKALLRAILSGGVWNGFLLGKMRRENVPCRFCGGPDGDGHLFWECSYPLQLLSGRVLSFMTLSVWIRLVGRGVFFGMVGYLLCLELRMVILGLSMLSMLLLSAWRLPLGSYVGVSQELGGEFSLVNDGVPLADAPDVWSGGSLVLDGFSGVGVAGCGVYAHASGAAWFGRQWGHLD